MINAADRFAPEFSPVVIMYAEAFESVLTKATNGISAQVSQFVLENCGPLLYLLHHKRRKKKNKPFPVTAPNGAVARITFFVVCYYDLKKKFKKGLVGFFGRASAMLANKRLRAAEEVQLHGTTRQAR